MEVAANPGFLKVGYAYDERLLLHSEAEHPEREDVPMRVKAIHDHLAATGLLRRMTAVQGVSADDRVVRRVHSSAHVSRLQTLSMDYSDYFKVNRI